MIRTHVNFIFVLIVLLAFLMVVAAAPIRGELREELRRSVQAQVVTKPPVIDGPAAVVLEELKPVEHHHFHEAVSHLVARDEFGKRRRLGLSRFLGKMEADGVSAPSPKVQERPAKHTSSSPGFRRRTGRRRHPV
ncbi:hypothetical protein BDQ12DRAFT_729022 [Crucibulum laeve]|uniref:Uncharacterized protein n=1 Tax=Crucibulum laeve TaxID=68775 RepID=A0A5C3LFY0_9AGAR|nr:hypothetical protein BDQ12DRAFT_729022 [Crucibulum laeve]